jgi:hypothetical protein
MGHLARVLRLSGPTHGTPLPWILSSESMRRGTHGTRSHLQPPECLARELSLNVLDLPILVKMLSALPDL